jgi:4-hydroxybenzoate polyprenyltransferase
MKTPLRPDTAGRERAAPFAQRDEARPGPLARWWIYQRERFPLVAFIPLVAAFSFCTLSYSAMVRGQAHPPSLKAFVVAFLTTLLFFLQLRIADEFKDAEDDARYRPYRPVPRGLITLRELGGAAIAGGVLQLALALTLAPSLVPYLLLVWTYLELMTKEFFVPRWLRAHPTVYMWSHMLILPLIDLYGTACDWRVAGVALPAGLIPLLIVSFCNGFVVEIGRKMRAPADEETGVETYSALWGRERATAIWLGTLAVTALVAVIAAARIAFALPASVALAGLVLVAAVLAVRFVRVPAPRAGKPIEVLSGVWSLLMYLLLGAVPLLARLV